MKRLLALVVLWLAVPLQGESAIGDSVQQVAATRLSSEVFDVDGLSLQMGSAMLRIEAGRLFAARPVASVQSEFVFIGKARIEFEPPDGVERGQLRFFTGKSDVHEQVETAVFVIANDAAQDAIAGRHKVQVSAEARSRAGEVFRQWVGSPERRVLGVDAAILRDAHGDPAYQDFFCAWMSNRVRGRFVFLVDPEAHEQVTLGRFEPVELSGRDKRKIQRKLHRQQQRGRLIGADVDLLGTFDTWISTSLTDPDGVPRPGASAFDAKHYDLQLEVLPGAREVRGRADIDFTARRRSSVVRLDLHADLQVERVEGPNGRPLGHFAGGGELLVFMPTVLDPGETGSISISYAGHALDRRGSSRVLLTTTGWYPNTGLDDRATFEVEFRWPEQLDLVASGVVVESGVDGELQWQRRRLVRPSGSFGFELGRFEMETVNVDGIPVTLAADASGRVLSTSESRAELLATTEEALRFFVEAFGEFPYPQLTLVTTDREFSQSLPGFITLSSLMLTDDYWQAWISGLEDPRGLIAHEVAHQWWGHVVGFASYRDVWLSEGMANYAAKLYVRERVPDLRFGWGPTAGWYREVTERLEDGTTVGEIGPVTLGWRLNSSRASAYEPIVYRKGALVLGMLAAEVGPEAFAEALRILVRFADEREADLSSNGFLELLGRILDHDFSRFAAQFVFGTGLPEIDYQYQVARTDDDRWRLSGRVNRRAPLGYRYQVVETETGMLDVRREVKADFGSSDATLYLPLRIILAGGGESPADGTLVYRSGRLALADQAMELDYLLDQEPLRLELDPHQEVFALTTNLGEYPKRLFLRHGLQALADGDGRAARTAFEAILQNPVYRGPLHFPRSWLTDQSNFYDARAHRELCRLELQAGRLDNAESHLDHAANRMSFGERQRMSYRVLRARLALLRDDPTTAYRLLERDIYRREDGHLEASLVFAIAAAGTGHRAESRIVLARLRNDPVEFGRLVQTLSG